MLNNLRHLLPGVSPDPRSRYKYAERKSTLVGLTKTIKAARIPKIIYEKTFERLIKSVVKIKYRKAAKRQKE